MERLTELSLIFKDQQNTPFEKAIFNMEFVLRHKNVVQFLGSSARTLNFLQYHSLDVIATLLTVLPVNPDCVFNIDFGSLE
jgi:hypothetical protein